MPGFSSVDDSPDPDRLARYLDTAAAAQSGMKAYTVAAHALKRPLGPILDVGSGAGHDLVLFSRASMAVMGLEPSAKLTAEARRRAPEAPLVRGVGESLPFTGACFAGVRIERVLQHVEDPDAILAEAVRVLRPDGLLTVFEPDWSQLQYTTGDDVESAAWLTGVPQPGIGGELWERIESAGCRVLDRVEELSVWRSLAVLDSVLGPGAVERAVLAGRIDPDRATEWLAVQRQREAEGRLLGTIPKVLIVAEKP